MAAAATLSTVRQAGRAARRVFVAANSRRYAGAGDRLTQSMPHEVKTWSAFCGCRRRASTASAPAASSRFSDRPASPICPVDQAEISRGQLVEDTSVQSKASQFPGLVSQPQPGLHRHTSHLRP
ncbi:hypothetical protein MTO96_017558 [Rhipicephalus appendiculatus]